jgi:hypothetical protein
MNMKPDLIAKKFFFGVFMIVCLALTLGWVLNVYKFFSCDFEAPYKAEIIYGIGIVTPISGITGYLDFGE